ncbi:type III PLP-dependent enzyme [Hamadaea tsunoensis]|uniref:type III PLP-dependent enzyme n=1 Tax=Hamadaea tsunoensis TaxID=53368 RepID=UPI00040B6D4E|nr:type III PLP-dependent enzyme [Hamadaea tsunoensis]
MISETNVDGLTGTDPPGLPETPFLLLDPNVAKHQYRRLAGAFPQTQIFYAVKANPEPNIIRLLAGSGSSFDVASPAEIDICLAEGVDPRRLSYGNTIKKPADIRYAYERGVRMFVFDSEDQLHQIAAYAPGAEVFCRLLASSDGAQWPLSRKFGCSPAMAVDLLVAASGLGLTPIGVSFHVGSQQLDPHSWEPSIAQAAGVFAQVREHGVELDFLNLGGGFPVAYADPVPPIEDFGSVIHAAVGRHFPGIPLRIGAEPGRYIAAEAGTLRASVVLVARKSYTDDSRWVYLDVGRFGGLAETEGEAIRYRIVTRHDGTATGPTAIAGPTCDSVDVLYRTTPYELPLALHTGDHVEILNTGAYTTTYSSNGFNGFAPLATICIGDRT